MLIQSAKRKRAMLASNPLRNSPPELIAADGQGMFVFGMPYTWQRPERKAGHVPGVKSTKDHFCSAERSWKRAWARRDQLASCSDIEQLGAIAPPSRLAGAGAIPGLWPFLFTKSTAPG
jgi:hypothetical protein